MSRARIDERLLTKSWKRAQKDENKKTLYVRIRHISLSLLAKYLYQLLFLLVIFRLWNHRRYSFEKCLILGRYSTVFLLPDMPIISPVYLTHIQKDQSIVLMHIFHLCMDKTVLSNQTFHQLIQKANWLVTDKIRFPFTLKIHLWYLSSNHNQEIAIKIFL